MSDILETLRSLAADATDFHGETMKKWDEIRAACLKYKGSDLPRLMFESLIESLTEPMVEAADEIERLRKAIQDYLDGNYENPRRHRHDDGPNKGCAHGRFYWEDCGNCIEDYFAGVLNPPTEEKSP